MDTDLDLKFLVIGDSGVGKTCLLNQYVEGQFSETLAPTLGVDIRHKNLRYRSIKTNKTFDIRLQLWDTAGQERFHSLTAAFFREAIGFLLVFDLTNEASFVNVRNWIGEIRDHAYSANVNMILVGNKCDLENERIISTTRAIEFAKQNHIDYIETSALKNIKVIQSIQLLLDSVMNYLEQNQSLLSLKPNTIKILYEQETSNHHSKLKPNLSSCCIYREKI